MHTHASLLYECGYCANNNMLIDIAEQIFTDTGIAAVTVVAGK